MSETKTNPKTVLEWFAFLNALLVQFSKLHGYEYAITHSTIGGVEDILITMNYPGYADFEIPINLSASADKLAERMNFARNNIVSYTRLTEKARPS